MNHLKIASYQDYSVFRTTKKEDDDFFLKTSSKNEMEIHEDRLAGEEKVTNRIVSHCLLTSPHGPTLLAPRWGAQLFRLRRKSSIRPSAPASLVALGGGRSERRAGRRRIGQVWAPLFSTRSNPKNTSSLQTKYTGSHEPGTPSNMFHSFELKSNVRVWGTSQIKGSEAVSPDAFTTFDSTLERLQFSNEQKRHFKDETHLMQKQHPNFCLQKEMFVFWITHPLVHRFQKVQRWEQQSRGPLFDESKIKDISSFQGGEEGMFIQCDHKHLGDVGHLWQSLWTEMCSLWWRRV